MPELGQGVLAVPPPRLWGDGEGGEGARVAQRSVSPDPLVRWAQTSVPASPA